MKFKKHEHGKEKKDREAEVKPDKDVRASHQRVWSNTKRYNVLTAVKRLQEETGQVIGLSHILPLTTNSRVRGIVEREHSYCKVETSQGRDQISSESSQEAVSQNSDSNQTQNHCINTPPHSVDMLRSECENVKRRFSYSR